MQTAVKMSLIHWKVNYDPAWDYAELARDLFGSNKCLIVAEKLCTNAHVHIQGYCDWSERKQDQIKKEWADKHYTKQGPALKNAETGKDVNPRPIRCARREVNETGFQYMCKEDRPPLVARGFTQEELDELSGKAKEVKELYKHGLEEIVHAQELNDLTGIYMDQMHTRIVLACVDWYKSLGKYPPPGFYKKVVFLIITHPKATERIRNHFAHKL